MHQSRTEKLSSILCSNRMRFLESNKFLTQDEPMLGANATPHDAPKNKVYEISYMMRRPWTSDRGPTNRGPDAEWRGSTLIFNFRMREESVLTEAEDI